MIDGCLSATLLLKKTGVIRELCGVTLGVTLSHSSQEKAYENLLFLAVKNSHLVAQDFACKQQYNNYPLSF